MRLENGNDHDEKNDQDLINNKITVIGLNQSKYQKLSKYHSNSDLTKPKLFPHFIQPE